MVYKVLARSDLAGDLNAGERKPAVVPSPGFAQH